MLVARQQIVNMNYMNKAKCPPLTVTVTANTTLQKLGGELVETADSFLKLAPVKRY